MVGVSRNRLIYKYNIFSRLYYLLDYLCHGDVCSWLTVRLINSINIVKVVK